MAFKDTKVYISGNIIQLRYVCMYISSAAYIENLCGYMKTKVRVTEFIRLLKKLSDERTLLMCLKIVMIVESGRNLD